MLTLYDYDLSLECYAVRLFARLVGADLAIRQVDVFPGRGNESEAFLALNPLGTVPVLDTGTGVVLTDWQAILAHLAFAHDPAGRWWPRENAALVGWLGTARVLVASAGLARLHCGMAVPADLPACQARAHRVLRVIERHLWFGERTGTDWLLPGADPTVADIACFPAVALAEEGDIALIDYPAIRRWVHRVRCLPGFVVVSGIFPPLASVARVPA